MKKCASCTKDLPDAALHCVFCGAKQAPAPAVAGSAAKTVMGHASNEVIEALKAQAAAAQRQQASAPAPYTPPAPAPYTPPAPAPYTPPPQAYTPPAPAYTPPAPAPMARPAPVPSAGSVAPTMFVPGGGPPGVGGPAPAPHPGNLPTMMAAPGGAPLGNMPAPAPMGMPPGPPMGMPPAPMPMPMPNPGMGGAPAVAPIPTAAAPYMASRASARAGRPIEPWKDTLRLMMFIWGGALIAAFMVPVRTEPDLGFMFQMIIDGEGTAKLIPLIMAAVGLLSIVLAAIPTSPSPRGLIAGLLGLTGILVPELLMLSKGEMGLGQIMHLVSMLGVLMMVPGLLLRSEYQDSIMPRIMVTIGALCVLASLLIPQNDNIPLVAAFEALIDAPGGAKVGAILVLGPAILSLLSLMVWLPAPGGAGTKVFAWLWIMWAAVVLYTVLLVRGGIGGAVEHSPYEALVSWVAGIPGLPIIAIGSAYLALTGFGLATVLGKKLE